MNATACRTSLRVTRPAVLGLYLVVAAGLCAAATPQTAAPDFSGLWKPEKYVTSLLTADGEVPPLLPGPLATYNRNKAAFAAGDTSFYGVHACLNLGQPRMNFLPYAVEIVDRPHAVAMIYEWNGYRLVDMTGAPLKVEYPTLNGTSVGRREQGALVITTQGLLATTFLDAAGMPHSGELKITERIRLLQNGKLLENRMTFEDPNTFSKPWDAVVRWKRTPGERQEYVCVDRMVKGQPAIDPTH
jgi:hypothetical protein